MAEVTYGSAQSYDPKHPGSRSWFTLKWRISKLNPVNYAKTISWEVIGGADKVDASFSLVGGKGTTEIFRKEIGVGGFYDGGVGWNGTVDLPEGVNRITIAFQCYDSAMWYQIVNSTWDIPEGYMPMYSDVTCTTTKIGGIPNIALIKKDDSVVSTLTYSFGNLSGTIVEKYAGYSYKEWVIPNSFYNEIPNSRNGSCIITCKSYFENEYLGETSCKFTVEIDESACKPILNPTVVDENSSTKALTGDENKLVRYYSNASFSVGASARYGATIVSQSVTCGEQTISGSSGIINGITTGTFVFTVKDSRGITVTQTLDKNIIDYVKLTSNIEASQLNTSGTGTLSISGNYYNGSFGSVANSITLQYRIRQNPGSWSSWTDAIPTKNNNTYYADITLSELDYRATYYFEVKVTDALDTVTGSTSIQSYPIFDWSKDDFNFNVPVNISGDISIGGNVVVDGELQMGGAPFGDYVVEQHIEKSNEYNAGQYIRYDIWRWRIWASGFVECWGLVNPINPHITGSGPYTLSDRVEFPVTFADTDYIFFIQSAYRFNEDPPVEPYSETMDLQYEGRKTNSTFVRCAVDSNTVDNPNYSVYVAGRIAS